MRKIADAEVRKAPADFRRRARAQVYLKDPLAMAGSAGLPVGYAIVGGDTSIAPGPTSSRFMVVDYDATANLAYKGTAWSDTVVHWTKGRGERIVEFKARPGTRQEAQVNAWATAVDTLDLFQDAIALGREVPWAFDGSRLRILPQAMYDANAFYSRDTRALHFGYFRDGRGQTIKTALSHDIIAHETAHAILDGLRPYYLESSHPDAAAFHEYVGDLAAMLSLFRQRDFVRQVAGGREEARSFLDLVANLAPQVGLGVYGNANRSFLRTAANTLTYRDIAKETEPHTRCQVLTGFAFELFHAVFELRRRRDPRVAHGRQAIFSELVTTARHVTQMLIRPLDLLPPADITFAEYTAILLRIDRTQHPTDAFGYRKAAEAALRRRGLHPDQHLEVANVVQPENRALRERDIAMIRSSRVGAYRFLDANRTAFRIPKDRDFRVVGLATNRRERNHGYYPPPETIIQYVWEERVALPGKSGGASTHTMVRGGGTLVVDDAVNLVHWSPQDLDDRRRQEAIARVTGLLAAGAVELEPAAGLRGTRRWVASPDGGNLQLRLNTAHMHDGRDRLPNLPTPKRRRRRSG